MARWQYRKGVHDLGGGVYAYLQPDGSWGWSNAGLIAGEGEALLIDTLFDVRLTREMLGDLRHATPAAENIRQVVNTHANGDHCWGNELVRDAEIIASDAGAREMIELPPERLAALMASVGPESELGAYLHRIFGPFDFSRIALTPPTRTFTGALTLNVQGRRVDLIEVGPAHTKGDVLVYLPDGRVLFTGDILFNEGHPVIWAGPVENWIAACRRILDMEIEAVVPGHGPITDKSGVRRMMDYLEYMARETRARFDAGLDEAEAARDIALDAYAGWLDAERIVVNVATLYCQYKGEVAPADIGALFADMARFAGEHAGRKPVAE